MKSKIKASLVTCTLSVAAVFSAPAANAGDEKFSLSSGFNSSSNKYEAGPWVFKLAAPADMSGSEAPSIGRIKTNPVAGSTQQGLSNTEAAATYNVYAGNASATEINLTGKVKIANSNSAFSLNQNDYAAQMDVYQSLDKFTAKGSLGSKFLGNPTGMTLDPLLYGSFGGIYQFTEKTSTGVDMSLTQDPNATGVRQPELSAYVNYKLDKNLKARGYVLRGFTNGNPNNVMGGQVYYGF